MDGRTLVAELTSGRMIIAEFCRQSGLPPRNFYNWACTLNASELSGDKFRDFYGGVF